MLFVMQDGLPIRKKLPHTIPSWIPDSELFFITINGKSRGLNQFSNENAGPIILKSAKYHFEIKNWYCRLLMLMPDHLHMLVAFPQNTSMKHFITSWKSFLHKQCKVRWQRDFFDHRIRGWESLEAKAEYIRKNPVRAGLVSNTEDWPWQWDLVKDLK
jgi:putative transposase